MYKIAYTSNHTDGIEYVLETLTGDYEVVVRDAHCGNDEEKLIEQCRDADVALCDFEPFTRHVLESLPKLKLLQFTGVGFNECDVQAATELGIAVCNCPTYCINEVADHVMSMMLAINRRLFQFSKMVKEDHVWASTSFTDMRPFNELTCGLVGFGNIARSFAKRMLAFGARVVATDPFVSTEVMAEYGVEKLELDDFLAQADYISIHLQATPSTIDYFNAETFSKCKDGVVLINASRGVVVNEGDLIDVLRSGKVGFAGLDVLYDEHPDLEHNPLASMDNVILTPHAAFYSSSARRNGRREAARSIMNYMEGRYDQAPIRNGVFGGK